jgi:hypothetical protein
MASIPGFVGGYNVSFSAAYGAATCQNLYVEKASDPTATTEGAMFGTPGTTNITKWDTTGQSGSFGAGGRGVYVSSRGSLYSVIGENIYKYPQANESIDPILIGTIPYSTATVRFADDGNSVGIVDGNALYTVDMYSDALLAPELPTGVQPTHIVFHAGRTIINSAPNSGPTVPGAAPVDTRLYYSNLYNMNSWLTDQAGSFAAILSSDPCTAIDLVNDQIIACGARSVEFFGLNEGTDAVFNPYLRVTGSGSGEGIYAPGSLQVVAHNAYWLSATTNGSVQVVRNNGYQVEPVSTPAIDWALATAGSNSPIDAIGGAYSQAGHTFYVLTSQYLNKTFVYDISTNTWATRSSRTLAGVENAWRYPYFASNIGKTYTQSVDYEGIQLIDVAAYKEFDNRTITRERSTGILRDELNNVVHHNFTLLMQTGTGNSAGTDTKDPQVTLSYSDDANTNWSAEIPGYIGNDGKGGWRIRWDRLGLARQRSYRIRVTAPVKCVIMDAIINSTSTGR